MRWFKRLLADRRGATALIVGLTAPALMGAVGLAIDANLLFLQAHRLQVAADAAAYEASLMLSNTTTQASSPASYKTIATNAVNAITNGSLIGSGLTVAVTVPADFSSVSVTLTTTQGSMFSAAVGRGAFNLQASAKAGASSSTPCVLSLGTGNVTQAIYVYGAGEITGTGCAVFSNSSSASALYVDGSGSITGKTIGAVGNGTIGANTGTFSPAVQSGQTAVQETSYSGIVIPPANYSTCTYTNVSNVNAMSPGTYCVSGSTTATYVGGSSQTVTMAAGTYYFVNSGLTFNSSNVTGTGVTFVFVGSTPGSMLWQNSGSGNFTAPSTGLFAGVFVYQACGSNQAIVTTTLQGGSPLKFTGGIYLPCGSLILNNNATLATASGGTGKVEASKITVYGSANLDITGAGGAPTPANVSLMQ